MTLKTFDADEQQYESLAVHCRKNRIKIGSLLNNLIKRYNQEHKVQLMKLES